MCNGLPTVVNKRKSQYDVYIGRPSMWENPFPIDDSCGHTREYVIEKYREYIYEKIRTCEITLDDLLSLQGKRLGCYCAPKPCHGDILVEIVQTLLGI